MTQLNGKTAILLTNLGTPDAPEASALRRYLAEFLSDPRVVEFPALLWKLVLYGVILNIRPKRSAAAYRKVWTEDGSPLLHITRQQAEAISNLLTQRGRQGLMVEVAMRYGNPSIEHAIESLSTAGVDHILVLPLYPQYSATTTASTFDQLAKVLMTRRNIPGINFIRNYCDEPGYIKALTASVKEHQAQHGVPDKLLISFHGIPQRYADKGDPYPLECETTARLLADQLGLDDDRWQLCYQSRFGREPWLQPYTDKTLQRWGGEGIEHVQVICPGFSADCLETLEEVDQENREYFLKAGGKRYGYIPALNDRQDHIAALADIVEAHLERS